MDDQDVKETASSNLDRLTREYYNARRTASEEVGIGAADLLLSDEDEEEIEDLVRERLGARYKLCRNAAEYKRSVQGRLEDTEAKHGGLDAARRDESSPYPNL